jgi:hypothetical protein
VCTVVCAVIRLSEAYSWFFRAFLISNWVTKYEEDTKKLIACTLENEPVVNKNSSVFSLITSFFSG